MLSISSFFYRCLKTFLKLIPQWLIIIIMINNNDNEFYKQDKNFNNYKIPVINVCPIKRKVLKKKTSYITIAHLKNSFISQIF